VKDKSANILELMRDREWKSRISVAQEKLLSLVSASGHKQT
jgi:hypothetical protein